MEESPVRCHLPMVSCLGYLVLPSHYMLHVTSYAFGYMPIYTSYTYIQLPSLIEGAYICDTPLDYIVSVYSHIYCIHVLHMCRESMAGSTS